MAQPVWVLSVDLQTKTATFQSGMAEAAKSARGAFTDIKSGAGDMGRSVGTNMFEARHGVMLLGEEFGVKLPRALTAFITSIGPVGAAMEAAFPFLAIAVGATLLIEHLATLRAAGVKLTEDQVRFGTAVENAFNALDNRIIQAQIKSDELRNDHLGALRHQLELIDKQSMAELVHSFAEVAKAADVVFGDLKTSWYQFGIGSAGAKHALDEFQTKYDNLLAQGKDKDASDFLKGTRESAVAILEAQKGQQEYLSKSANMGQNEGAYAAYAKSKEYLNTLSKAGVGFTEKETQAQQTLVDALNAQLGIEQRVNELKKLDSGNASASTGKEMAALQAEGARAAAEHAQKMKEIELASEKETAEAALNVHNAGVVERLASDIHFENEAYRIAEEGNRAKIAALDRGGKDYNNQLKALQEKAEELTAQHTENLAKLGTKATEDAYKQALATIEQGEREKIDATEQGSKARLSAIQAAMKEQESLGLQESAFYRDLSKQRVEAQREAADQAGKLAEEAGKEDADHIEKMGELALGAC